jgi:hypothetical protein
MAINLKSALLVASGALFLSAAVPKMAHAQAQDWAFAGYSHAPADAAAIHHDKRQLRHDERHGNWGDVARDRQELHADKKAAHHDRMWEWHHRHHEWRGHHNW